MISMVKETDFNFINVMETVKFNQKKIDKFERLFYSTTGEGKLQVLK